MVTACAEEASSTGEACRQSWAEVEERFGADGLVRGFASENDASVILKVENGAAEDRRLIVDLDGVKAVDIDVPGSLSCDHPAVLTLGFDHPPGALRVDAESDGDTTSEQLTVSETEQTWIVVQVTSDGITTDLWDERPQFGDTGGHSPTMPTTRVPFRQLCPVGGVGPWPSFLACVRTISCSCWACPLSV